MNKTVVLSPYFGELPEYFSLFLHSAENNYDFDFIVITDADYYGELPANVRVLKMSFSVIQKRTLSAFGTDVVINKPYKLSDYRPGFGIIFEDLVKGYDWWGYVDLDVILGDLSHFLRPFDFEKYDKIGLRGHLTLYNSKQPWGKIMLDNAIVPHTFSAKESFSDNRPYHFDEDWGVGTRYPVLGIKVKTLLIDTEPVIADVSPKFFDFRIVSNKLMPTIYRYFKMSAEGVLTGRTIDNQEKEFVYLHLQKRHILINPDINLDRDFYVTNTGIDNSIEDSVGSSHTGWPEGNLSHIIKYYTNAIVSGELLLNIRRRLR